MIPFLCFLIYSAAFSTVDPVYPPNAVGGGMVVAQVEVAAGGIRKVDILSGEEPFVSSCKSALARGSLPAERDGRELIVVLFRRPEISFAGSSGQKMSISKAPESLPCPEYIVEPAYPPSGSGQGSVVLRADISSEGRVTGLDVVKPMGVFTDASMEAVRKWRFVPARDGQGRKTSSHAYAVLVFRFPLIAR